MPLNNFDVRKLRLPNGRTVEQQMKYEGQRFMGILQDELNEWYSEYTPVMYQRTYAMLGSVFAEDLVEVDYSGTTLEVRVKYSDLAMHKSLWSDDEVNTLFLLNNGYQVSSGWHRNVPYFGYREGGHFLDRAVERFNRENELGIVVNTHYY